MEHKIWDYILHSELIELTIPKYLIAYAHIFKVIFKDRPSSYYGDSGGKMQRRYYAMPTIKKEIQNNINTGHILNKEYNMKLYKI